MQEPQQPVGNVWCGFLAVFQYPVITCAVVEDAGGHGIKADGLVLTLSQCQISDGTGQAAVAIVEWVERDKPEVRDAGAQ
ncbi:hypothetical protein D3C85_1473910 [compost metagenome]